ncbi:MAG: major facilitator superfamily domain-containing protein [Benniella sp.]|nr:MAG: major facilitator superfamily domain-containing protein [Benniella sp.]
MATPQETTTPPPPSTVVAIPTPTLELKGTDVSSETTVPSLSSKAADRENLRQKLQPLLLYVVSTAQFLDVVNGASVSVAILPIAKDLSFSIPQMTWILNAYTIAFAGLLLFSGRLGDLFGHRRVFLFGLFWFATWALVVSFSTSPIMFVISRALQGVGAANTVPSAMALIATTYPAGPERTKAFSIFAAFGGLGAVVGILMAGGLISSIGWTWIFRISSIAAYILLGLGFLAIPSAPRKGEKPKIDYIGAATATLGVTGIVYYITTGVEDGWAVGKTLPVFIVGVLLIAGFIFVESKVQSPLMPLRIWKSKRFSSSVILAFVQMAMFQGVIYFANMVFQEVYQWTAIQTALGFLAHSLLAVVVFTTLGRIMPRLYLKPLILVGFLLRCGTALMFSFVDQHTSYWRLAFPALIVHIFGAGFSMLPIQITAVRDADNKDQGLVGAIYNTGLQLGAPFGLAILNVISVSTNTRIHGSGVHSGPALMDGYRNAFYGVIALGLFGFLLTAILLPWDKPHHHQQSPAKTTGAEERMQQVEERDLESGGVSKEQVRA